MLIGSLRDLGDMSKNKTSKNGAKTSQKLVEN
jgi:hypothetical protein